MITVRSIKYSSDKAVFELDTGERLSLGPGLALELGLSSGSEINSEKYNYIKDEAEKFSAFEKSICYLSTRMRSAREIRQYLAKKGFSASASEHAIERLLKLKYLNDANYAERFIAYQKNRRPVGRHFIESGLALKGIPREIIKKSLKRSFSAEEELESAIAAAEKKLSTLAGKPNISSRLYSFLAQRGFGHDVIARAIRGFKIEDNDSVPADDYSGDTDDK